ncbi:MAG TPA: VOC family protein [Candidatus Avipropionibacterium avicola]|uniref:VOC family protein n=1 Tax=Candidatus Avipropionibacterium avicola TaxID=2840701 RepID=A0A9D1GZU9_9ACTN|nr:VOC family protein [Candidatus Avipropionibacterium avicola]
MIRGRSKDGWLGTVLGARNPRALGRFWADLLGWQLSDDEETWVTLGMPGHPFNLAVQLEPHHEPPVWPGEAGRPGMQLHLDIAVNDLAGATEDAVALGARLAEFQPQEDVRVLIDPEGHPFCLYRA